MKFTRKELDVIDTIHEAEEELIYHFPGDYKAKQHFLQWRRDKVKDLPAHVRKYVLSRDPNIHAL